MAVHYPGCLLADPDLKIDGIFGGILVIHIGLTY